MSALLFQRRTAVHEPIRSQPGFAQVLPTNDPAVVNQPAHVEERIAFYQDWVLQHALQDMDWTFTPVTPGLLIEWLLDCPVWQEERGSYFTSTKQRIIKTLVGNLLHLQQHATGADKDSLTKVASNPLPEDLLARLTEDQRDLMDAVVDIYGDQLLTIDPNELQVALESHADDPEVLGITENALVGVHEALGGHPSDAAFLALAQALYTRRNRLASKTADRKGRRRTFQGFSVVVEFPKGSTRSGVAPDGTKWQRKMLHDYGYLV